MREVGKGRPLTVAQRQELDRRLDQLDREGPVGIPAAELFDRLRAQSWKRRTARPIVIGGEPISRTIIEDRGE